MSSVAWRTRNAECGMRNAAGKKSGLAGGGRWEVGGAPCVVNGNL